MSNETSWRVEIREFPRGAWYAHVRNPEGRLVLSTPPHLTKRALLDTLNQFSVWMACEEGYWDEHFVELPSTCQQDLPATVRLRDTLRQLDETLQSADTRIGELEAENLNLTRQIEDIRKAVFDREGPAAP